MHGKEYLETHQKRFDMTIDYLKGAGFLRDGIDILELGCPSEFTEILKGGFSVNVTNTGCDLRYTPLFRWKSGDLIEEKFDLVLCMELIAHIKDQDTEDIGQLSSFNGSGIKNLISECSKRVKEGGRLFVSTPNVHCYRVFENWCLNKDIYTYDLHPRELSVSYLEEVLGEHFNIKVDYFECWSCHGTSEEFMREAEDFLRRNGLSVENRRDDNVFILCEKL